MGQVALYRGQGAESVYVGDSGGTFTNIGPDIVYYGDQNASATVHAGSIAVGASVRLTGSPYLVLAPTATRAYVNVVENEPTAGTSLQQATDLDTSTAVIDGNLLYFDSASGKFKGATPTAITGGLMTIPGVPSGVVCHSADGTAYKLVPPNGGGTATWVAA